MLDTNVLSELVRRNPEPSVIAWLDGVPGRDLATTAVTAAELFHGVERLAPGKRRTALREALHALLHEDLRGRVEPFDAVAAEEYALVVRDREAAGMPVSVPDAQIAAVCRALGATLATRNVKDFVRTGIALIDPWSLPAGGTPTPD
ncbi:type II toxin-antitoxin system VapC family toxin [Streptomyces sp. DSM 42041]|uniref:Ribonuclease VapC n=1 Tax=Streptomyces hazeniae TaxID=3075538 RepID=A0ABU2NND4_9ACTN|nr:type II toxin-antitoxin system VapC family toxin [Streptomyces sp. DSM 42041]MDT0378491.1 type II toxin-antitoxin system VapC family toxin [Streptomyces sp. DSM 42041]